MANKRILMIADADSFWTVRYLRDLLLPAGFEAVVFPIWGDNGTNTEFYRENGIQVYHDTHRLPVIRHIPRLRMWVRIALNARDLKRMGPFDVVHNHYLSPRDLALGKRVARAFGARWVGSFWGSDLLRAPKIEIRRMKRYLNECDVVNVMNKNCLDKIAEQCGEQTAQKMVVLDLGHMSYNEIDAVRARYTRTECRAKFGIAEDRFVVCVGYNSSSAQQQLQALTAMATLPEERLKRITVVLQQTYCENDPDYVAKTREFSRSMPWETVVLTKFMGPEESAWLRLSADVFVHGITTDAFSVSLQEYLYAGACVLKGAWLQYSALDELGIELNSFSTFDELPDLLSRAMDGELRGLSEEQRALLPARYSWDSLRGAWLGLYGSAYEGNAVVGAEAR